MISIASVYRAIQIIYIVAQIICKYAPRIMASLSMLVTLCSATAAVVPRSDLDGNPSGIHRYLDVIALNVLNSAHEAGFANEIESHRPSEESSASDNTQAHQDKTK